jgi:hypothetical protein
MRDEEHNEGVEENVVKIAMMATTNLAVEPKFDLKVLSKPT